MDVTAEVESLIAGRDSQASRVDPHGDTGCGRRGELAALVAAVLIWYSAHAHSVVVSSALLNSLRSTCPLAHVALTAVQVWTGVVMAGGYLGYNTYAALPIGCDTTASSGRALLCAAGFCSFIGTAGTNASMASTGAAQTQLMKASEPIFTALLQILLFGKMPSALSLVALAAICSGTLLATSRGDGHGKPAGALPLAALAACVSLPLMRVLTKSDRFPNTQSGAHILFLLAWVGSLPALLGLAYALTAGAPPPLDARFVWSAISYNLYQLASLSVLKRLDAISHSVGNAFKRVFVIAITLVVASEPFEWTRAGGAALCVSGILLHAFSGA